MGRQIRLTTVLLLGLLLLWNGVTWAGGPLFISGDDSDSTGHCQVTACGGLLPKALNAVYNASTNGKTGILAIGVNSGSTSLALSALNGWNSIANGGPGAPITFATSTSTTTSPSSTTPSIATVDFSLYRMIYVPSGSNNTTGGITQTQLTALNSRKTAIQAFVDSGGGVLALTEQGLTGPYSWLPVPTPLTFTGINDTNIDPTANMAAWSLTTTNSNMDHCCYHTMFTGVTGLPGTFGNLKVLAVTREHNLTGTTTPGPVILARLKLNQTITFAALINKTYGDPDFAVSASASSNLAVSFSASGNCTVSTNTVHITGAGSCTITASQAGNDDFNAAPDVQQTFSIARKPTTVSITGGPFTYDGNPNAATVTTNPAGVSVSVNYSRVTPSYNSTTAPTNAGTYTVTVTITDTNYVLSGSNTGSITINKASQTITFGALAGKTFGDADFTVSATGGASGNPVTFSSLTTPVCTVSGGTVHIVAAGSCTIRASQAGNDNYNAATDVDQSFTVVQNPTTVSITGGPFTYDTNPHAATVTTTPSGVSNTVNYSRVTPPYNSTTAPTNAGTYTVTVTITDTNYTLSGSNTGSITILPKIITVAGTGTAGFNGDTDPITHLPLAKDAQLNLPFGVAVDGSGNLYIADRNNSRIRKVDTAGNITTVVNSAGTPTGPGFPLGDSSSAGSASAATLNAPYGIAVGGGNLYIADYNNQRIRMVNLSTMSITTVAGTGDTGSTGDGGPAIAARLFNPTGVAVEPVVGGVNVYIADSMNHRIRKVDTSGNITTVAGTGTPGSGDDSSATLAQLNSPFGVAVDSSGNLYIADKINNRIRKVSSGTISTVHDTDGTLNNPTGVAVDGDGNLLVADSGHNQILKVKNPNSATGDVVTVAGTGTAGFTDNVAATAGQLNFPTAVAPSSGPNFYIVDNLNQRVRKVVGQP